MYYATKELLSTNGCKLRSLHLCNAFFETEIEESVFGCPPRSLKNWLYMHPMFLQLQFLPLLYASQEDVIFVSDLPENPDPRLRLIDDGPISGKIELWGSSLSVQSWMQNGSIDFRMPDWEVVKRVNSKIFSFLSSSSLQGSALLTNLQEVMLWMEKTPNPKVLKTAYGTAGRGHFHIGKRQDLTSFLKRQFAAHLPVLAEPWVERVLDFSTQWVLGNEIVFIGATIFENRADGSYLATLAGKEFGDFKWALEEHLAIIKPILQEILDLGFFGNLGVDAFVYRKEGNLRLHPVVEINARKTMSWIALCIREKYFPKDAIRFSFEKGFCEGILPQKLCARGKEICFSHQIRYTPMNTE